MPEQAISKSQRRHFFHLSADGATPEGPWTVCVDNHHFQLFWAPSAVLPSIAEPQEDWLMYAREVLQWGV